MEITPGELKKLAEIAGVRITIFSNVLYYHLDGKPIVISTEFIWQPHIRIEQAMMVAEQYIEWSVGKTSLKEKEKLYHAYVCTSQDDDMWFRSFGKTPSEAICRAALTAAKEG